MLCICKMQRQDNDHFHLDKMNFSKNHLVVNCFNEFFMFYSSLPAERGSSIWQELRVEKRLAIKVKHFIIWIVNVFVILFTRQSHYHANTNNTLFRSLCQFQSSDHITNQISTKGLLVSGVLLALIAGLQKYSKAMLVHKRV